MYPNHSTSTAHPSRTFRSGCDPVLDEIRHEKVLADLHGQCELFLAGLYNLENDPAPLFHGLTYEVVMDAATHDRSVRRAAERLVKEYPRYWQHR